MLEKKHEWKVAIAGECMLTRPFREHTEPEFLEMQSIMQSADICYGHLEMNFGEFKDVYPSRGNWLGSFMLANPTIAKDLRWLGINMMSTAHNHSFDYGPAAVLSTIAALHNADIACAGTGSNLDIARAPVYWEGKAGRVALISTAAGNGASDHASVSKNGLKARPGINPTRIKMKYSVPRDVAEAVREIGNHLGIYQESREFSTVDNELKGFRLMTPSEQAASGDGVFVEGDCYAVESFCHPDDLEENMNAIYEAKQHADFVMIAQHFNYADGARKDVPPKAVVEFAHAAIDAGADVYLGHGWHKTLGVEIYKGKPIFYGLGNFFMQSHYVQRLPYDTYETRGIEGKNQPVPKPSEAPHPGITQPSQLIALTSALIELEYSKSKEIKSITFYPVEMGIDLEQEGAPINRYTGTKYAEGRPILAKGNGARRVIERLQKLSAPLGTQIEYCNGIGYWKA